MDMQSPDHAHSLRRPHPITLWFHISTVMIYPSEVAPECSRTEWFRTYWIAAITHIRFYLSARLRNIDGALCSVVILFALWGLFGLTESPGSTLDEGPIADAAMSLAFDGHLAVKSAGPGEDHESAYLYQMPGYIIVLAAVYKVAGVGLLQGRLLSLALACIALLLIWRCGNLISRRVALLSTTLVAVDPLLSSRARENGYDWMTLVALLGACCILLGTLEKVYISGTPRLSSRLFVSGLLAAIATSSHVLGVCFVGACVVLLLVGPAPRAWRRYRVRNTATFLTGFVFGIFPVVLYILNHLQAFRSQFLFQVMHHKAHDAGVVLWLRGEFDKYLQYYHLVPTLGVAVLCGWVLAFSYSKHSTDQRGRIEKSIIVLAITMLILLTAASGHHPWHNFLVAPMLIMVAAIGFDHATHSEKSGTRRLAQIVIILALCNGLGSSWLGRTYSAIQSWNTRDVGLVAGDIDAVIPPDVSVYGDYRLLFHARIRHWDYVASYFVLNTDTVALAHKEFAYIVLSDMAPAPAWLDLQRYKKVAVIYGHKPFLKLPSINADNAPMCLTIYARAARVGDST